MKPFAYELAADAAGAVALLGRAPEGARYLAGGTNLVDLMKLEVETPELHQVDEVGAAGQVARAVRGRRERHRPGRVRGSFVGERLHRPASAIAGTMLA